MRACSEAVPLYPVYALLFAGTGLSTAQVSSLFALWSIVAFAAEIPSGALADAWSRKRLYALGELITAAGFATWTLWPSYPGFALGFVLWGLGGSLSSGALEALVYDSLSAAGRAGDYARIMGRANTVSILAMLGATLLAAPAWQAGGHVLVGALSVAIKLVGAALSLHLPEKRGSEPADDSPGDGYWSMLRSGLRETASSRPVARKVLVAALIPGFTALDEYLPLLSTDKGASIAQVPLLYAVTALTMAAGSALAGRRFPLPAALTIAAAAVTAGALIPHLAAMIVVSVAFGLLEYSIIRAETRLQDSITGPARSTVLSVAGFGGEVFAVALYAVFAFDLPMSTLFTLCALPLLATAMIARR
ncbi:MFS transporter [Paractinoplanes brasiliensis]|uniref:Putative MFS family arabinose efflux permease n=1 Tax=Paractinoplanes brasiliensis TaxID=52695 RepID=A0A4R6JRM8_9ACTN|nr:MFS transporter [Actinoplanes brasiliensis]TDO38061.1 putative MFS family arabinose efflux permease [Actinoplanes brasiliensis]GID31152.1 MFS transporter [Actinoplanes brasiliensis]